MTLRIPYPLPRQHEETLRHHIQQGLTLVFPTETYYAVGGNALSAALVERIFHIKQRPRHKPLLLLITPAWLPRLVQTSMPGCTQLIEAFWPGPLTLICPMQPQAPQFLAGPQATLAVRHSSAALVEELINMANCPLIGTSANLSAHPECSTADQAFTQLGSAIDVLIDGGTTPGEKPSTIVNLTTRPFQIEREGAIPLADLQPYLH